MYVFKTVELTVEQKEIVFNLWNNEYPENLGFNTINDLDLYLSTLSQLNYYFLKSDPGKIEGWAMVFGREDENWFAITIDSSAQGLGKGTFLLNKLKEDREVLNGWVIDHDKDRRKDGEVYHSPLSFYLKNGFKVFPEIRLEIPILSAVKISWQKNDNR